MITKDNISEVLMHNSISVFGILNPERNSQSELVLHNQKTSQIECRINLNNPNLIPIIEAHIGKKLEPLPKPSPFDVVKVGQWVRMNVSRLAGRTTKGKWYQRVECNNSLTGFKYTDDDNDACTSNHPEQWDLTEIRDYNPNECELKIGDIIDFGSFGNLPIDEFNYIDERIVTNLGGSLICRGFKNLQNNDNKKSQLINGKAYNKITIPPFDFEKTLLDAGWNETNDGLFIEYKNELLFISKDNKTFSNILKIKPTPANAECLIKAVAMLDELELA